MSQLFSDMVVRGVEGVDEMDEHRESWLPLPPVMDEEASSIDDVAVENSDSVSQADELVELPSRVTRLEYRCLDLKLPHPFLNPLLRGVRKIFPSDEPLEQSSEMTRVDSDGSLATLDRGLLLLCPALWGIDFRLVILNLAMMVVLFVRLICAGVIEE